MSFYHKGLGIDMKQGNRKEDEIHVAFGLTDRTGDYTKWVGMVILSVLQHTNRQVCFHVILDQTVGENDRYKLVEITEWFDCKIRFYEVDPEQFSTGNQSISQYSVASLYRLTIPDLLPELQKVIYLDADILFLKDIGELWDIDISNYCIAAARDLGFAYGFVLPSIIQKGYVRKEDYFNSGVLVMNLEKIRHDGDLLQRGLDFIMKHPETVLPDQDALNYLFRRQTYLLDNVWNCQTRFERRFCHDPEAQSKVYHFMGNKHIDYYAPAGYDRLLLRTMSETPWGYAGIEKEVFRGFETLSYKILQWQKLAPKLSITGMKHIYYGLNSNSMQHMIQIIPPKDGDYCILKDMVVDVDGKRYGIPVKEFDELLSEQKGCFTVFVLPEADDGQALSKLDKAGLQNGEDYFVIPALLVGMQGGYWA